MKKNLVPFLFFGLAFLLGRSYNPYQSAGKQKIKSSSSKFIGTWKGKEKCNSVSAPVAILIISNKGLTDLNLSGIYSIQGNVKAVAKGDTIYIPRQEVTDDPNFTNLLIEGKLAFSGKPASIMGRVEVLNNQVKDECIVSYYK